MKIKICGIRRPEDAVLVAEAGADAIGILHGQQHPSPDFVDASTAAKILAALPPFVSGVLVTHVPDPVAVLKTIRELGFAHVQIHSEMSPDGIRLLREVLPSLRILKSLHVVNRESLAGPMPYLGLVEGFVLDTYNPHTGQVGGSGLTHDWQLSRELIQTYPQARFILAGGLHASNVAEAIAVTRPYGVDVNSGTKGPDGFKSPEQVRAFIEAVRSTRVSSL